MGQGSASTDLCAIGFELVPFSQDGVAGPSSLQMCSSGSSHDLCVLLQTHGSSCTPSCVRHRAHVIVRTSSRLIAARSITTPAGAPWHHVVSLIRQQTR